MKKSKVFHGQNPKPPRCHTACLEDLGRWFYQGFACTIMLSALLLAGCGTTASRDPYREYDAVLNTTSPTAGDDKQAIEHASILALQPGEAFTIEIAPEDPKLRHGKILSNYKVFSFQGVKDVRYKLELRALCDCWGLDKFMPYPKARILDRQGNTINDVPESYVLRNPDWSYPINIHVVWRGQFQDTDEYYFLVSTYNNGIGTAYSTYQESNSMHPLWSVPAGRFVVTLTVDPLT